MYAVKIPLTRPAGTESRQSWAWEVGDGIRGHRPVPGTGGRRRPGRRGPAEDGGTHQGRTREPGLSGVPRPRSARGLRAFRTIRGRGRLWRALGQFAFTTWLSGQVLPALAERTRLDLVPFEQFGAW